MTDYTFRFGTYGTNNPLYYTEKSGGTYTSTTTSWSSYIELDNTVWTPGFSNFGIDNVRRLFNDYNASEELKYVSSSGENNFFQVAFKSTKFNEIPRAESVEFHMKFKLTSALDADNQPIDLYANSEYQMEFGYTEGTSSNIVKTISDGDSNPFSIEGVVYNFKIVLDKNFLNNNTLKYFKFQFKLTPENTSGVHFGTNPKVEISNLEMKILKEIEAPVEENTFVVVKDDAGKNHKVYLCPWELKHVDSISIGVAGNTTTVGLPGHPASKTQIFDSAGAVRTFKISGRRYDWEEDISNWDFLNTQFNLAVDPVAGKSPDEDGYYTYIGLAWLLSNIQVLLRGYYLYIGRNISDDRRFIGYEPTERVITRGYNVALTGLNTSFSESEPGLLNYTITLTERFKYGDAMYTPYNPDTEVATTVQSEGDVNGQ